MAGTWQTTLAESGGDLADDSETRGEGDPAQKWRATLGRRTAPGGDGRRSWRGRLTTLAGDGEQDPGGDGGRPWRGRRTTVDELGRDILKRTLAHKYRDDRHSWPDSGTDSGRLWHGRRMTADDSERAGEPGELVG